MGSFGDRLRREREQRGISLDDIALTTKIRAGLLQALEEEKFDRLPGGIFNKGFVRAYARHLGLDEDQLVADYLVASGEGPVRRPGETSTPARGEVPEPRIQLVREDPEPQSESGNSLSNWGILAGLLVLVVVGLVAWVYYHREKQSENLPSSEPAAVTEPASRPSSNPAPSNQTPASPTPAPNAGAQTTSAPPAATSSAGSAQKSDNPAPAPSLAVNATGTFTVRLKADEDCWLQITSDGKTEEVTMDAGFEKAVTARDRVTVRAGSVGALAISFNGSKLPSQGDYGQVKTLVFGPQGLQPPAPKPMSPPPTPNP
jgi:cytoskeleton protein RodZ